MLSLCPMGRIIAIDYGRKRTGLAVTDTLQMIANGLTTVPSGELTRFLADYVSREPVERFVVKPGVTGWAQVTGYRGETKTLEQMEGRVKRDVWYIENWSFFLDLKIIVVTVINMFKGEKNAY